MQKELWYKAENMSKLCKYYLVLILLFLDNYKLTHNPQVIWHFKVMHNMVVPLKVEKKPEFLSDTYKIIEKCKHDKTMLKYVNVNVYSSSGVFYVVDRRIR